MTTAPHLRLPVTVDVFDPALCCATGVCGPDVDQDLVRFAADAAWAGAQGARLTRHNLAQDPLAFAQHPVVAAVLKLNGAQALPLLLLNGELALSGRYPTREELTRWIGGAPLPELSMAPAGDCGCTPGTC